MGRSAPKGAPQTAAAKQKSQGHGTSENLDDPFIGLPLSVVLALLDAAGDDAERFVEDDDWATIRSFQAALITLRILKLHDLKIPEAWLRREERLGSGELVAALRSQAWQ